MPGRTLHKILIACAFVGLSAHAAAPTKLSANAGEIRDFVAASATVGFAGTVGGGIWKTADAGANWSRQAGLAAKTVWKIAVNPASAGNRLYAATDSGVWRSTDGGNVWTQLTRDPTRAIAIAPAAAAGGPETLLAGVTGAGIYKSTDSGTTFVRSSAGLDSTDLLGIAYYPGSTTVAYAVLQCNVEDAPAPLSGNWGGVFRSTDGGVNWAAFNTGLPTVDSTKPCANAIAANGTAVVVGIKDYSTFQGCTYRLTSSGAASWTISASSGTCNPNGAPYGVEWLGPDFTNANGFFLGSNQFGPWRSTDGGNTFAQIADPSFVQDPDFRALTYATGAFAANAWVTSIHGLGLFRTTTGNSPWSLPAGPIKADRVNDLTSHYGALPNTFYMALKNGGVMKSVDAGTNWTEFDAGISPSGSLNFVRSVEVIAAHPNNGSVVALGMRQFGLYQLTGGSSWAQVSGFADGGPDHKPQSLVITPAGSVYYTLFDAGAATPGGLFKSTATGTTIGTLASQGRPIFEAAPGLGVAPGASTVRIMPSNPEVHQYMMMWDSLPYRTGNGGSNWARISVNSAGANDTGFQRHAFFDIVEKPGGTNVLVGSTNRGIYRSVDFGGTWNRVNASGLVQTALSGLAYSSNSVLWGGDLSGQLWCSGDDGVTWNGVTGGNLGASITELKAYGASIYALTDGAGVWKKDSACP